MNEQNKIRVEIDGSVDGLRRASREAEVEFDRLRTSATSSSSGLSSLRLAAEGVGASVVGMSSAVGVAGAAWVGYQAVQVAAALAIKDTADDLGKLSQRLGISVESLSGLRYAAELSDVSLSELHGGLKNLANRAQDNAPVFKAMGISVRDASGEMKSLDALLAEVAEKFAGYDDGIKKTALANDVFGRSGEKLLPLLNQGAAGLRDMADEAKKLGVIYGDELSKKSEEFNDNLTRLKFAAEGLTVALGGDMMATLARLSEEMVQGTKAAGGFFSALMMGATLNPMKSYGENLQSVRADLAAMESDLKEYGYLDEKRYERKKAQLEYLKSMQRYEALQLGNGAYSNEGRSAGTGKTEAPTPEKKRGGAGRADPLDGLLENYRRDALAQEVGLSPSTVKEIENLGELIARGKIDAAEYDRLLGAVLDKDSVLKKEQSDLDAAEKKASGDRKKAGDLIADYERGNATMLERIRRESELALMGEKQRAVAEALYKVEDEGQRLRERIIRDIADETARTEALAEADAMLAEQKERVAAATAESIDQQRSFEFGWQKAMQSYADDATNAAKTAETAFSGTSGAMEGLMKSFLKNGKADWKSFGDAVIDTLIDIQMQALRSGVLKPMMGGANSWISSLFSGGSADAGDLIQSARGNAFSGVPSLSAYSGTVVDRPTVFPFARGAGLMGEAGPEGIFPLKRGRDGKLGVSAEGAGGISVSLVTNNYASDVVEVKPTVSNNNGQLAIELAVQRVISRDMAKNGPITQGFGAVYGLARTF